MGRKGQNVPTVGKKGDSKRKKCFFGINESHGEVTQSNPPGGGQMLGDLPGGGQMLGDLEGRWWWSRW